MDMPPSQVSQKAQVLHPLGNCHYPLVQFIVKKRKSRKNKMAVPHWLNKARIMVSMSWKLVLDIQITLIANAMIHPAEIITVTWACVPLTPLEIIGPNQLV